MDRSPLQSPTLPIASGPARTDLLKAVLFLGLAGAGICYWARPTVRAALDSKAWAGSIVDTVTKDGDAPGDFPTGDDLASSAEPTVFTLSLDVPQLGARRQPSTHSQGNKSDLVNLIRTVDRAASRLVASQKPAVEKVSAASNKPGADRLSLPLSISTRTSSGDVVVTSIVLGLSRRGAVINGRLHREGDKVLVAGEAFRLSSVGDDRVELVQDRKVAGHRRRTVVRLGDAAQHLGD